MPPSKPFLSSPAWLLAALVTIAAPARAHEPSDHALEALDREIAARPGSGEPYRARAELLRLRRALDAAMADLDRADRLGPADPISHFLRGRILLDAGRPAEARAELERFLASPPPVAAGRPDRRPAAHLLLARAWRNLGELSRAADESLTAVASELPLAPQVYVDCAEAALAAERAPDALACLDRGLDRLGPSPVLTARAVAVALGAGRAEEALARLGHLAVLAPAAGRWQVERGELLVRLGRADEAAIAFATALAEIERLPPARRRIAAIAALDARARAGYAATRQDDAATAPDTEGAPR